MTTAAKQIKALFYLTKDERMLIATILTVALIGIVSRYLYLKNEKPEPYSFDAEQAAVLGLER